MTTSFIGVDPGAPLILYQIKYLLLRILQVSPQYPGSSVAFILYVGIDLYDGPEDGFIPYNLCIMLYIAEVGTESHYLARNAGL